MLTVCASWVSVDTLESSSNPEDKLSARWLVNSHENKKWNKNAHVLLCFVCCLSVNVRKLPDILRRFDRVQLFIFNGTSPRAHTESIKKLSGPKSRTRWVMGGGKVSKSFFFGWEKKEKLFSLLRRAAEGKTSKFRRRRSRYWIFHSFWLGYIMIRFV